jgi:putative ATP-dependent endonuclease of the OLD family
MQLVHARVKNFRSLRDVSISFGAHTALIGGNGAGKSSILKAIDKFYDGQKKLDIDDYFSRDTTVPVEIQLTFGHLNAQELDAFKSRVRDGKLVVTRIFDGTSSSGRYFGSVAQSPDFVPIRLHPTAAPRIAAYKALREAKEDYRVSLPAAASAAAVDQAMSTWEDGHPDALELHPDDGQFFGFQNAGRGALQRHTSFVFIPAVREASVDAADGKSSAIGRLLELIVRSAILKRQDLIKFQQRMTQEYRGLVAPENMPELGQLADQLTLDLRTLYQDARVDLDWRQVSDFPVPLPAADVTLSDDGFGGPVDRQGHGLQRAFVFTLLQNLAKASILHGGVAAVENGGGEDGQIVPSHAPSLILAIEEPELYQHPTKQRHFTAVLRALSDGSLPGVDSPTQIMFGSHSPVFVALDKADEIRLTRRIKSDDTTFKECQLKSLDLGVVAQKLGRAHGKPDSFYTAETLIPRLHILGAELAEGFFANGVILVEGRSDKAALYAIAKLTGVSFEQAGIAVLSAEGKGNLDRPYIIFGELGIPVFILWDCDNGAKQPDTNLNLALLRLVRPDEDLQEAPPTTHVAPNYAHFEGELEGLIKSELGVDLHRTCLTGACEPLGLTPSDEHHKIPEVMHQTLLAAKNAGKTCPTLEQLVKAAWLHLTGKEIDVAL